MTSANDTTAFIAHLGGIVLVLAYIIPLGQQRMFCSTSDPSTEFRTISCTWPTSLMPTSNSPLASVFVTCSSDTMEAVRFPRNLISSLCVCNHFPSPQGIQYHQVMSVPVFDPPRGGNCRSTPVSSSEGHDDSLPRGLPLRTRADGIATVVQFNSKTTMQESYRSIPDSLEPNNQVALDKRVSPTIETTESVTSPLWRSSGVRMKRACIL